MYPASNLPSSSLRNHGLGVLRGACKEYAAVPLLQTSQKSWSGCPPRHLQRVCGLPLLQTSQKSWSGCPLRRLQRVCRCASAPDKSEIRMAWVSTAAPATEHSDCLCSSPFPVKSPSSLVVWAPDLLVMSSQKSSLSHPVMNGFSYLYYDTENLVSLIPLSTASCTCTMMQRVCLFRPDVRYLCNAFRCMNRSPVTPLFTVFSSCHIVKLGNKSHGHLSTLGIRFVLSFSLCSVVCLKLSIKSHSYISIVGICLGNAISLCYSVFVFVSYYVHSIGLVCN